MREQEPDLFRIFSRGPEEYKSSSETEFQSREGAEEYLEKRAERGENSAFGDSWESSTGARFIIYEVETSPIELRGVIFKQCLGCGSENIELQARRRAGGSKIKCNDCEIYFDPQRNHIAKHHENGMTCLICGKSGHPGPRTYSCWQQKGCDDWSEIEGIEVVDQ